MRPAPQAYALGGCPSRCPHCRVQGRVIRRGTFPRARDGAEVVRFQCRACGRHFSNATGTPSEGLRLPDDTLEAIRAAFGGKESRRALARRLGVDRKTVRRVFERM